MMMENIIKKIYNSAFPSEHQQMVNKWYADGGDYELRFDYDLDDESVVLDVGGYQGQWASDLFSRYRCRIYVFEPVSVSCEKQYKKDQKNDLNRSFPSIRRFF